MTDEELSRIRREAGRKGGLKGGKAKVPRGFAKLSPDLVKKISAEGGKRSKGRALTAEHRTKIAQALAKRKDLSL